HNVCIYAINTPSGNNPTLACRTVTVRNQDPTGFVDTLTGTPTGINLSGWVLDPDSTDPVTLHIYVDGTPTILSAAAPRPDIDAIFGKGPNHGFSTTIAASTGTHNVCIYAINTPSGNNPTLACRTVTV
ncbi:hypothetical protein ACTHAM_002768, partial [Cellulomonas soli]